MPSDARLTANDAVPDISDYITGVVHLRPEETLMSRLPCRPGDGVTRSRNDPPSGLLRENHRMTGGCHAAEDPRLCITVSDRRRAGRLRPRHSAVRGHCAPV